MRAVVGAGASSRRQAGNAPFLVAAKAGATDALIADALRQGPPHLTDPASLQRKSVRKEVESTCIQAQKDYEQSQQTRRATTQPALLAADAFAAALEAIPADDWFRTWAAGRTIMLRRTSKRVKEVVDKIHLTVVVRLTSNFWDDDHNDHNDTC